MSELSPIDRATGYLSLRQPGVQINEFLGGGTDGDVWATSAGTAIKVFKTLKAYGNEWASYDRLAQVRVSNEIDGFWVPRMRGSDEELMVVEMDVMQQPPYIIDFGKVRFASPEFSPEVISDQDSFGREQFEHNWPAVRSLLAVLESYDIYYLDPRRGNITFPDMP